MPRGTGQFRLRPRRDYQGRVVYTNGSVALGLFQILFGAVPLGGGLVVLHVSWPDSDWWAAAVGGVALLAGLAMVAAGLAKLYRRQRLVLDGRAGQAELVESRISRRRRRRCPLEQVRLRLHEIEFSGRRRPSWRGFALAFHVEDMRFVAAQVHSRDNAEQIAAETQAETAIPWDASSGKITLGPWGLA